MANQADSTIDHKRIQTKCNDAYEGMLVTTRNEVYASVDNAKKCQMKQNQAYVPTNPEGICSICILPAARVSEDEYYAIQEQYFEQISITNDDSAPTQQLRNETEENDVTYDYITH